MADSETCFGDDILSLVQVVTGLPAKSGGWVSESQIVATLRRLNKPLGKLPFAHITARLSEISTGRGGGWLRARRNGEDTEYAIGMGALARLGRTQLERLRSELRAQMAEVEAREAEARTARRQRVQIPPELERAIHLGDDTDPITPSDLGAVFGVIAVKLLLSGRIHPPPRKSTMEKLAAVIRELQTTEAPAPA